MSSPGQHESRNHVSTLRRLLRRRSESDQTEHQKPLIDTSERKPRLASSMLLRGLGCASAAAAHVPSSSVGGGGGGGSQVAASAVREAADWDGRRRRSKKKKKEKKKVATSSGGGATSADVWCVEASVDCVVERAHREVRFLR